VFTAAPGRGLLARRLRQPLILGYALAGLILTPLTPGLGVRYARTFEIMAEIGVILQMGLAQTLELHPSRGPFALPAQSRRVRYRMAQWRSRIQG
jgi:CPA2 family monovalent cation:H+ antiporter-2